MLEKILQLIPEDQTELYEAVKTQVEQSTKIKSEFIANISHEIRTPLTAILGFSNILLAENPTNLTDKQQRYINNITKSGRLLLSLINDLLDIAKIEAGSMNLSYEKFDSSELIAETVSSINSLADQKNISVKLDVKNIIVKADKGKVRQIIYNLLSNAIKFTPEKGNIIVKSDFNNSNLIVSVEDTGIGIAKSDHDKIFEEFRQIDSSYSRLQEGAGLGLTLTKKLVELHEGSIQFESTVGVGSRFWFILPKIE
ncbi:MAG: HAMP domain-containing sensor histidine kinase [Candidatus Gastranaerophilaceae bacterium]